MIKVFIIILEFYSQNIFFCTIKWYTVKLELLMMCTCEFHAAKYDCILCSKVNTILIGVFTIFIGTFM